MIRQMLEAVCKALVDSPEELEVREIEGRNSLIYEMRPASKDVGKLIGKRGRNADAIRTIANAAGVCMGKRVFVDILEPHTK